MKKQKPDESETKREVRKNNGQTRGKLEITGRRCAVSGMEVRKNNGQMRGKLETTGRRCAGNDLTLR